MSDAQTGLAVPDPWRQLRALTPARIALGRAGASLPTAAHLRRRLSGVVLKDETGASGT